MTKTLSLDLLRPLTVDPEQHPRGAAFISAASGLVCAFGQVYVIADDEHHLAVFNSSDKPGILYRLVEGNLPDGKKARKRIKPDFETLLLVDAFYPTGSAALMALGSGSRANRCLGVVIPLDATGTPSSEVIRFDLNPLYEPLIATLGEINIEGAFIQNGELVLLNRGVQGKTKNCVLRFSMRDFLGLVQGIASPIYCTSQRVMELGEIDGVELGFTDGAATPDGSWMFTAAAENRDDSYTDGPCLGSMIGRASALDELVETYALSPSEKVEGLDIKKTETGYRFSLVTDSDDPEVASVLFVTELALP